MLFEFAMGDAGGIRRPGAAAVPKNGEARPTPYNDPNTADGRGIIAVGNFGDPREKGCNLCYYIVGVMGKRLGMPKAPCAIFCFVLFLNWR